MRLISFLKSFITPIEVFTIKIKSLEWVNTMIIDVNIPELTEETRDD